MDPRYGGWAAGNLGEQLVPGDSVALVALGRAAGTALDVVAKAGASAIGFHSCARSGAAPRDRRPDRVIAAAD